MNTRAWTTRTQQRHANELWVRVARVALILLMLLIVVTPVTQSIWNGDNILQTGGDTEHTLVLGLSLISLSLLVCRNRLSHLQRAMDHLREGFSEFLAVFRNLFTRQASPRYADARFEQFIVEPTQVGSFGLPLLI